jgi:hypothetical protein
MADKLECGCVRLGPTGPKLKLVEPNPMDPQFV